VGQREAHCLAGYHVEVRSSGRSVDPEFGWAGKQQPVGAPPGGQAAGDGFENRVDQAVLGAWSIADFDLHLPVRAGEMAQQYPGGPRTQVMTPLVAADRHRVGQHRGTGRGHKGGLQHHGLVHVDAAGLEVAGWPDREVPATSIEDAGEHGRRVEPGET
jgi:hypothetical protein